MRVLALDTTARAGSSALVEAGQVVDSQIGDASRTHAERLPGELVDMLSRARLTVSDVDAFAVVAGPGSFTGLRIGIATMQGLALVAGRPMAAASALDLLGHAIAEHAVAGTLVGAWIDAHREEVYAALFRVGEGDALSDERLIELDAARVGRPDVILHDWASRGLQPSIIAGDGAPLCPPAACAGIELRAEIGLAAQLGRWASAGPADRRLGHPARVQPVYIRRPDAEIARDQAELTRRASRS